MGFLSKVWGTIAESGKTLARLPRHGNVLVRGQTLADELLSEQGAATGAARAQELLSLYSGLLAPENLSFLKLLAGNFVPDRLALSDAAKAYLANANAVTASALSEAAESPRRELLRRMNIAPGGTAALVEMREALLDALPKMPELKPLDDDLVHLFSSWFNPGFLELRRIDWNSPAALLEKLIAYEAVHEIKGWGDLRRRLQPYRRCFAFFHPALPGEPLIFVEVALCKGLASKIAPLLTEGAGPEKADTAIFYSISNCQKGLRGISFGNFLIRFVVEALIEELPALKQFATLSPIPGFRRWLERSLKNGENSPFARDLTALDENDLASFARGPADAVANELTLKPALENLCALYLTTPGERGPMDPVARFHLKNGARLERINWAANLGAKGMVESYGLMVNYLYDIDTIEANHEKFVREGKIAVSAEVTRIMRGLNSKSALARVPERS
jgi:malonyl-CoA decarboxylase